MAKVNKMMPPRNTTIRGQDHLLAYITPEEAQLLMDNGGAGKPGPMGIPAFYSDEDDAFAGEAMSSFESDYGGGNDGGNSYDDELPEAIRPSQITGGENLYTSGSPTLSMGTSSQALGNIGGERGIAGLNRSQYNSMPFYMRELLDTKSPLFTGAYNYEIGPKGRITGFYGPQMKLPGVFGLLGKGITALDKMIYGEPMTEKDLMRTAVYTGFGEGSKTDGGRDDREEVKPVDPETGQCEDGYIFDEDLQACRLDTGTAAGTGGGTVAAPTTGGYAQMGLLDMAPTGLPQFQQQYGAGFGTPSQFAAANTDFRRRGAVMPAYPGYTLLS